MIYSLKFVVNIYNIQLEMKILKILFKIKKYYL